MPTVDHDRILWSLGLGTVPGLWTCVLHGQGLVFEKASGSQWSIRTRSTASLSIGLGSLKKACLSDAYPFIRPLLNGQMIRNWWEDGCLLKVSKIGSLKKRNPSIGSLLKALFADLNLETWKNIELEFLSGHRKAVSVTRRAFTARMQMCEKKQLKVMQYIYNLLLGFMKGGFYSILTVD